jgi:hypothetical protein
MSRKFPVLRALAALLVLVAVVATGGCSSCGAPEKDAGKAAIEKPRIEPMEGFKYFVGGPTIAYDHHGRQRVGGFNGEVLSPPSEGVVIGLREMGDDKVEYYSYLNGRLLTHTVARRDKDGLLWNLERENFEDGVRVRQEVTTYDDNAAVIRTTVRRYSATDGELIDEGTVEEPYAPGSRYVEDDEDDEGGEEMPLETE